MFAASLLVWGLVGGEGPLTPLELSVIPMPDDVRTHRARMVTSPRLHDQLKMTADQRANCMALKQKIAEDAQQPGSRRRVSDGRAWIKDGVFHLTFDDNDKGVEELLDAKQLKRLGQIQLQSLGPWAVFRINCTAKFLELSDDQRQKAEQLSQRLSQELSEIFKATPLERHAKETGKHAFANKDKHLEILSPAQLGKLGELLGDRDGGGWLSDFFAVPSSRPKHHLRSYLSDILQPFRVLFVDDFLAHLEVTTKERERLVELIANERKLMSARLKTSTWDFDDFARRRKELNKERDDDVLRLWRGVKEALDEKRVARVKEAWRQARGYGEIYSGTETARLLRVTAMQQKEFSDFCKGNVDREVRRQKAVAILTPRQRTKWEELKGAPLPTHLLTILKSAQANVNCDEFGIPLFGIGAPP